MSILVNGAPKSATLFVAELFRYNLAREDLRVSTRGSLTSQIMPHEFYKFVNSSKYVAQQHIAPSKFNFSFLQSFPPRLFILLIRDPRDIIISWKHHVTRADLNPWEKAMYIAEGVLTEQFYNSDDEQQLDFVRVRYFPKLCSWLNEWLHMIKQLGPQFHVLFSKQEILNNQSVWINLLRKSGIEYESFKMLDHTKSKHHRSGKNKQFMDVYSSLDAQDKMRLEIQKHHHLHAYLNMCEPSLVDTVYV